MRLRVLDPTNIRRYDFLAQDQTTAQKLVPCAATEFEVIRHIGSGADGLVLECRDPQSSGSVALKLFFHDQQQPYRFQWPLKNEASYYTSCADRKAQFSEPSVLPLLLPRLPLAKWAEQDDQSKLLSMIKNGIEAPQLEATDRYELLRTLDKMCANGWVAFSNKICARLQQVAPRQDIRFTGAVIIGIVKPFFKKEDWSRKTLETQAQTMLLMREFGWRLKEFQNRNWINGYLVDGGDVDVNVSPLHQQEQTWRKNVALKRSSTENEN